MQISLSEQIRCVEREISMRKRVYPGLVIRGKMTEGQKDREIATMQAVYQTLILAERTHIHCACNQLPENKGA